jgi:predicted nucleic acid-binding protein
VLAQGWRGGPQAELSRFLKGCEVIPLDEALARECGRACARARTADVVDACVVVVALRRGDAVVTSDPDDLRRIAVALRRRVEVLDL